MNKNPDITLVWMYGAEWNTGGLSAWKSARGWEMAYPECTGYAIPTLFRWGAGDLSERCAEWLLTVQNQDGSFNGLDGVPRPFDTTAIIEGLRAAYQVTGNPRYITALAKAEAWVILQRNTLGYLNNSPGNAAPEVYNLRASAIVDNRSELHYWKEHGLYKRENRSHYLAYALEGLLNFGEVEFARPHIEMAHARNPALVPFFVNEEWQGTHPAVDLCASAQMGILYLRIGLDASKAYESLKRHVQPNGGIYQAPDDPREILWAAKFWLDFKRMYNETDV
jgi:hypothetical protein